MNIFVAALSFAVVVYSETPSTTPFSCEPPDGAEATLNCIDNTKLLRAMGSRNPFFGDVIGSICTDMNEQIYVEQESVYVFFSEDNGISVNAKCPEENDVIVEFKMCIIDMHVTAITLHCRKLKNPDRIDDRYQVTSDDDRHQLVDCRENGAIQGMNFMDSGNGVHTRVVFDCLLIQEKAVPEPEAPAAETM